MEESFKLKGLLKLKKFKEHCEKVNLGKILKKIEKEKLEIKSLNKKLEQAYHCQKSNLTEGMEAGMLRVYPKMIQDVKERVEHCEKNLKDLKKEHEQTIKRLNIALGDVNVLQSLENSYKDSWKKKMGTKKEQAIEDVFNMRRADD